MKAFKILLRFMVRTFLQYWHLFRVFQNVLSVWWTWSCLSGQCDSVEACVLELLWVFFAYFSSYSAAYLLPAHQILMIYPWTFFFTIHTHSGRFHSHSWFFIFLTWSSPSVFLGFPCGSAGKVSTCSMGDLGSLPGLGRSLEKGKATHSNILACRIPWTI